MPGWVLSTISEALSLDLKRSLIDNSSWLAKAGKIERSELYEAIEKVAALPPDALPDGSFFAGLRHEQFRTNRFDPRGHDSSARSAGIVDR